MTTVYLQPDESPEALIKRFRKKVQHSGILSEVRRRRHFIPKSEQRRLAHRKAVRRARRRQRKRQRF
ncbi:MAG: 30S ribosomal protein S21 [Anaerolineae bacterium]|nr:30S ribosomal protein S21 [Anaerolineae bacterium]RLC61716.1 MAG: 30S ribosomal protein S21 [Chloroflexota bacterium]